MKQKPSKQRQALAADVWRLLFDFLIATSEQRQQVLAGLDLTPNESRALHALDARAGRTMRELADEWGCDASNATWIVDRLESRGLAVRRGKAGDRRVKMVTLTAAGVETRARLLEGMYEPPRELLALPVTQLKALRSAATVLSAAGR